MKSGVYALLLAGLLACAPLKRKSTETYRASCGTEVSALSDSLRRTAVVQEREQSRWVIDLVREISDTVSAAAGTVRPVSERWHITAENIRESRCADTTESLFAATCMQERRDTTAVRTATTPASRHRAWGAYAMLAVLSVISLGLIVKH